MADEIRAKLVPGPCPQCGEQGNVIAASLRSRIARRQYVRACAVCFARVIDAAMEWRLTNTVLTGINNRDAALAVKNRRA